MKLTLFILPEHLPQDAPERRLAEHLEQVRVARQAGFDGVVIGHHICYGPTVWFAPFPTLARIAAEADGMEIGTCMLLLPLFHPLHVAQEAALLDLLSGGRLVLGVAPGWQESEYRVLGLDFTRRIGRFVEAVTLIRRLWTEERVDFAGRHFALDGVGLALKPLQRPRPRFWLGGSTDPAVARAARLADPALGDSWVCSAHLTHDVISGQAAVFLQTLAALGKPMPRDFPALRNVVVARDRATALREAGPYLRGGLRVYGQSGPAAAPDAGGADPLALLAGRVVLGAPEECAAELAALAREVGFTRLVCRVQWLGMEQHIVLRTIELLGARVLPLLAKELS